MLVKGATGVSHIELPFTSHDNNHDYKSTTPRWNNFVGSVWRLMVSTRRWTKIYNCFLTSNYTACQVDMALFFTFRVKANVTTFSDCYETCNLKVSWNICQETSKTYGTQLKLKVKCCLCILTWDEKRYMGNNKKRVPHQYKRCFIPKVKPIFSHFDNIVNPVTQA